MIDLDFWWNRTILGEVPDLMLKVLDTVGREYVSSIPKLVIEKNLWGIQHMKTKKENVEEDNARRDMWLNLKKLQEGNSIKLYFKIKKIFLAMLHRMWDLNSPTRGEPMSPALGTQSLYHWITREVLQFSFFSL